MRQSRLMPPVEAAAKVFVGFGTAVATQLVLFPTCGIGGIGAWAQLSRA